MSELTLEEAKAYLKQDKNGQSIYDHLSNVLMKILTERPDNSCETFEQISVHVKQSKFNGKYDTNHTLEAKGPPEIKAKKNQEIWCNAALQQLKSFPEEDEIPTEPGNGISNFLEDINLLEYAGISFSKGENFRISIALQNLAQKVQCTSIRIWGKLLGNGTNYYVCEGLVGTKQENVYDPENAENEEGTDGINKYTYWIMKEDGNYSWIKLPNVTRKQILCARKLKRFIRDDLDAKIKTYPPFPGTEINYIRAQIARINASTVICPSNYYIVSEDNQIEENLEEIDKKTLQDLLDLSGWIHLKKEINETYGRTIHMPIKQNDEGEDMIWENDIIIDPLRSLTEDKEKTWRIEKNPSTLRSHISEIAIIKSLIWPGAVTVATTNGTKKFVNIYIGYGNKYTNESYQFPQPETIQTEYGVTYNNEKSDKNEKTDDTISDNAPIFTNLVEQTDMYENPNPSEEVEEN